MANLKNVTKNTFFYAFSSILLRASSLILFPIFSLYLTKEDYGILSITQSIGGVITIICGLELNKSLTRFIYNHKDVDKDKLLSTIIASSLIFSVPVILLLIFTGKFLLKPILNDIPFYPYVFIFLFSIPFNSVVETYRTNLVANHEGFKTFVFNMAFFSINIIFNLFFVVVLKMNVFGIILGILVNAILFSIISYYLHFRNIEFKFDYVLLKEVLKYSLPLISFAILNILFDSIDRYFLNSYNGSKVSGIYYIALTFASIFSSLKESIINAFTPWLFANIKEKKETYLAQLLNIIFSGTGILAIGIAWFSKEILLLLSNNPDLVEAYKYIPFTVMGLYIIFLGQLYNIKTFYFGKYNRFLFIATLIGIIADIIACYILVDMYGIQGAVLGRIIAFTVQVMVIIFFSNLEKEKKDIYSFSSLSIILIIVCSAFMLPLFDTYRLYFFILKTVLFITICIAFLLIINKQVPVFTMVKSKLLSLKK